MLSDNLPLLRNADIAPGTRVLVRVDYNVSVESSEVRGEFRIERSFKTINFLRERGARILLISHIESTDSLEPVSRFLETTLPHTFVENPFSEEARSILHNQRNGDVVLFDNLRAHSGEKGNDEAFARSLSELADIYVNDAFSVSHREHASIVGVPKFLPGFVGFLLEEEIHELEVMLNPEKPLLFVLGGAKFETKLPLITKFQTIADTILIGGALANDIYKAQGFPVGNSLVSGDVDLTHIASDPKVVVPSEVVVLRGDERVTMHVSKVESDDVIVDASPEWVRGFSENIQNKKTVLWNGPLGKYEVGAGGGTLALAKEIARANTHSVVGGGDTLTVISENNLEDKFSFISTGGGAMLDFLSSGTLPGIEALKTAK